MTINRDLTMHMGLCGTCVHTPSCMYLRNATSPVWRCGEFDDRVPVAATTMRSAVDPPPPVPVGTSAGARGLCVNCARLAACSLPKAEGGVFWCEEWE